MGSGIVGAFEGEVFDADVLMGALMSTLAMVPPPSYLSSAVVMETSISIWLVEVSTAVMVRCQTRSWDGGTARRACRWRYPGEVVIPRDLIHSSVLGLRMTLDHRARDSRWRL